jgi:hypothetical protein
LDLGNNPQSRGKKIALVLLSQLLPGFRKWRAWKSCCHNINTSSKRLSIEAIEIFFYDVPSGTVKSQRLACMCVEFNQAHMGKSGLFETKSLSASTGAQFKNGNCLHEFNSASDYGLCLYRKASFPVNRPKHASRWELLDHSGTKRMPGAASPDSGPATPIDLWNIEIFYCGTLRLPLVIPSQTSA